MNPLQLQSLTHYLVCSIRELEEIRKKSQNLAESIWISQHDEVLNLWEKAGFLGEVLDDYKKTNNLKISSQRILKKCENKIISQYNLYFDGKKIQPLGVFELGEFSPQIETIIKDGDYSLTFLSWDKNNYQKHAENIVAALRIIKTITPLAYERFCQFTHTIIPIYEIKMVSYSLQTLPGYSFINLYNRDRLDLMDDLIHENGHHHLNCILRSENLFDEQNSNLYFSPWREQLRPLRGIYHAYFTFYWAWDLYRQLYSQIKKVDSLMYLSTSEKIKIEKRMKEEKKLLANALIILKGCKRKKIITKQGWKVIQLISKL